MRIYKLSKELLKVIHNKDRVQYVVMKNYHLLDKRYIKMVFKPLLADIKSKYIIVLRDIIIFDSREDFIKEVSNPLKYKLDIREIQDIINKEK